MVRSCQHPIYSRTFQLDMVYTYEPNQICLRKYPLYMRYMIDLCSGQSTALEDMVYIYLYPQRQFDLKLSTQPDRSNNFRLSSLQLYYMCSLDMQYIRSLWFRKFRLDTDHNIVHSVVYIPLDICYSVYYVIV
jgi:hypothetical protein